MKSLVEAALLDQERRIIAAHPRELVALAGDAKGTVKCQAGCGRGRWPSKARPGLYFCRPCRVLRRTGQAAAANDSQALRPGLTSKCDECGDPCAESKEFCAACIERLRLVRVELRSYGWTAARTPIHPDDIVAR